MIIKFVYGKEIHIYDLKQNESFTHACEKIRQMFKRLPEEFVLTFRNNEQLELEIDTNEQFDQLINNLQSNAKTIKLYITDVNDRKVIDNEPKQDQNLIELNEEKQEESNLMQEMETQNFEQESGKFTDLHHPLTETHDLLELQQQHIQEIKSQEKREFEQLNSSDQQEHQVEKQVQNYLKNKIENINIDYQREIDANLLETSDPNEIKNLGQEENSQKEVFSNQLKEIFPKQENIKSQAIEKAQLISNQYEEKQLFSHSSDSSVPQKISSSERKKIFQPYEPKPKIQSKNIREHQVKCNMCNSYPIIGARYKCVVCEDYDLCEKCEQKFQHQHPLLKINYPHQTPVNIRVQIPQFAQKQKKQPQIVLEKEDISDLDIEQRKQRFLSIASQLSDLLDIEFQQCANFIRQNEQYTKETLTQLLISRKNGNKIFQKIKRKQNEQRGLGVNQIFANIKDVFKGFISK